MKESLPHSRDATSKIQPIYFELSLECLERSLYFYVKNTKKCRYYSYLLCGQEFASIPTKKIFEEYVIYTQCVTSQKLMREEEIMTVRSYSYPEEELTKMVLDFSCFSFTISCLLFSFIFFFLLSFCLFLFVGENFKNDCMKWGG